VPHIEVAPASKPKLDFRNLLVLIAAHLLALCAFTYLALEQCNLKTLALALAWLACSSLSITSGYHRLFAHRAYRTIWSLRLFYLLFGAAALQNSALNWCADHRIHHVQTDRYEDPYNRKKGFWWAHIGWIIFEPLEAPNFRVVRDLEADRFILFQHRHYSVLAVVIGLVVPDALGMLWGDPLGSLLVAGILRVVAQWHATWFVNSVAHTYGRQPYTKNVSARDSWITALITLGEGYHNFHHRFPSDYRNGVKWYQFDPTKWFLWILSKIHLVFDLRRISAEAINRARVAAS
jgi:stearoyl-CoA desaturase (Delta-9 desaturase)